MRIKRTWKTIVAKAWSFRLMVLATVLTGAEVVLPLYSDSLPRGLFATLSGVVVVGAMISRLMVQKDFEDGDK